MTQKNALITGGTSGIGLELAKLFAAGGYNLVLVARDETELENTAALLKREHNVSVATISKDLFEPDAAFELYNEIRGKNLEIQVLVNDAGQGQYGKFIETDIRRELDIIQLNICSLVVLTKLYLKEMVARGEGKILNVSSIAGKVPGPWQSVYHGTKAFVQSFTEAIRSEVKDSGVVITALLPGATDTDFFNKAEMTESKIVQEGKLADAAGVAKDGYEALMRGDDMVISGFMNKVQVGMANVLPDETAADYMNKQQEPAEKNK
ncbi:MAG: SDR family oxidoreductase [Flavipsychrobacter sp.]|nr:SDR family oxidoreductase [Flavipsychrobacter sp.]